MSANQPNVLRDGVEQPSASNVINISGFTGQFIGVNAFKGPKASFPSVSEAASLGIALSASFPSVSEAASLGIALSASFPSVSEAASLAIGLSGIVT